MQLKASILAAMIMGFVMLVVAGGFTAYGYVSHRHVGSTSAMPATAAARPAAPVPAGIDVRKVSEDNVEKLRIDPQCRSGIEESYPDLIGMASVSGVHGGHVRIDYVRAVTQEVWSFQCDPDGAKVAWNQVDGIRSEGDDIGWEVDDDGGMTLVDGDKRGPTISSKPRIDVPAIG